MSDYFTDDIIENKLGIADVHALKGIEEQIVADKTSVLLNEGVQGIPDVEFLKHVHKVLFEDLYDFAGTFRTVDITKPDSKVPFAYARFLDSESARIFSGLAEKEYLVGLDKKEFANNVAHLSAELNALHPFRDGNGRAIRLFLILLADAADHLIDYSQVSAKDIIQADKAAFEGDDTILLELYAKAVLV